MTTSRRVCTLCFGDGRVMGNVCLKCGGSGFSVMRIDAGVRDATTKSEPAVSAPPPPPPCRPGAHLFMSGKNGMACSICGEPEPTKELNTLDTKPTEDGVRQIAIDIFDSKLRLYVESIGGKKVGEWSRGFGSVRHTFMVYEGVGCPVFMGMNPVHAFTREEVDAENARFR